MEDIIQNIATALASALALGATGLAARLRQQLAPQRSAHALRICVVSTPAEGDKALALKAELEGMGYEHVGLTHAAASAYDADLVVLWKPAVDAALERVTQIRETAPLGYLVLYTQDHIPALRTVDDRTMLSNSRLRLLNDIETVAKAYAARKR